VVKARRSSKKAQQARIRRTIVGSVVVLVAGLVVAVGFHVALAQGQLQLDHNRGVAAEEQARYEKLRVDVATVAAPARVLERAKALGLVEPDSITFLDAPPVKASDESHTESALQTGWSTVKPKLDAGP
jgi:hypothetical protein